MARKLDSPRKEERMRDTESIGGDDLMNVETQSSNGHEDKILVSVRLRPLNDKEIFRNDGSDWECINNTTIIFKNSLPERSMFPSVYTYDRVFGCECPTKQVYEEGAKEVALSVVSGINSSIFAYGQTSSGKTYTMRGITEYAIADIYDYIERHQEREFVLKFSAMEIYNEAVRDLLSFDSTPLRLLDDPERGTVVERLTEETLRDQEHLQELLSICEAQRQIGETSLNETSSRSHQILRLTIDSTTREYRGAENSSTLTASVNFVDLAGSERASQTLSAGPRLKEGCHINRSLLTLGTVIRKLSKGKNGHVPYRDSKLTRILQNSLGGNAKTAIICTMSPSRSHVEQSRNTLSFASCAKEVMTNAHVNVLMSDKALVKQLQKELARLETELKSIGSNSTKCDSDALLKEKELQIEQMDREIKELKRQRDLAQSRVENLLQSVGEDQKLYLEKNSLLKSSDLKEPNMLHANPQDLLLSENSEDNFLLDDSTPKFIGLDPCQGWDEIDRNENEESKDDCKVVRCIETQEPSADKRIEADMFTFNSEEKSAVPSPEKEDKEASRISTSFTYDALKQKVQEMQKTINSLVSLYPLEQSPSSSETTETSSSRSLRLTRSRSCRAVLTNIPSSLWLDKAESNENTTSAGTEKELSARPGDSKRKVSELKCGVSSGNVSRKHSQSSRCSTSSEEKNIGESDAEDTKSVLGFSSETNGFTKLQTEKQVGNYSERAFKAGKSGEDIKETGLQKMPGSAQSDSSWPTEFERQRREIVELWDICNVPLVHRTYFFLLFQGHPSDSVYIEVELRRLSFLKDKFSHVTNSTKDGQILAPASSLRALNRERETLSKRVHQKLSRKEREELYTKWGIGLNTKQRSLQLTRCLWTNTKDMVRIKGSAELTAKLIGFIEPCQAPKEIFGLSFLPRSMNRRSYSWKHNMSALF